MTDPMSFRSCSCLGRTSWIFPLCVMITASLELTLICQQALPRSFRRLSASLDANPATSRHRVRHSVRGWRRGALGTFNGPYKVYDDHCQKKFRFETSDGHNSTTTTWELVSRRELSHQTVFVTLSWPSIDLDGGIRMEVYCKVYSIFNPVSPRFPSKLTCSTGLRRETTTQWCISDVNPCETQPGRRIGHTPARHIIPLRRLCQNISISSWLYLNVLEALFCCDLNGSFGLEVWSDARNNYAIFFDNLWNQSLDSWLRSSKKAYGSAKSQEKTIWCMRFLSQLFKDRYVDVHP